jgi:hypothetical protein
LPDASAAGHGSSLQGASPAVKRSTAGVGFGLAKAANGHTAGGMVALEGVMETPEEVAVMRQLLERGWSRRRIATELGISRHTVSRYLALGEWQPYSTANRASQNSACRTARLRRVARVSAWVMPRKGLQARH